MRLFSGFSIFRQNSERSRRASWLSGRRGRQGVQDRRVPPQEEAGRSFVSRNENLRDIAPAVSVKAVVIAVSQEAGISTEQLLGRSRTHALARYRHLAFVLAHELTHEPMMQIGRAMNRDHSTVWAGMKRCRERMLHDADLEEAYNRVYRKLKVGA